jgi:hypothetical protein
MNWLTKDPARDTVKLLSEVGLCHDPAYAGEIARLLELPGYRRRFSRRSGVTVDRLGELFYDRGLTLSRPTPDEVLCWLDEVLRPAATTKTRKGRRQASRSTINDAERHARVTRLRKFLCDACGQIARASTNTVLLCGLCHEMHGAVVPMRRVDPTVAEVLAQACEMGGAA